jgi:hypothetical protein
VIGGCTSIRKVSIALSATFCGVSFGPICAVEFRDERRLLARVGAYFGLPAAGLSPSSLGIPFLAIRFAQLGPGRRLIPSLFRSLASCGGFGALLGLLGPAPAGLLLCIYSLPSFAYKLLPELLRAQALLLRRVIHSIANNLATTPPGDEGGNRPTMGESHRR